MTDVEYMELALVEARKALELSEVPVGCIFVKDGEILATGHNDTNRTQNGTRHAELCAMATRDFADFEGSTLYVTVEPCIMCASALRQAKIKEVFFGAGNERFGGCGSVTGVNVNLPNSEECLGKEYNVYPSIRRREAIMLLRMFYTKTNPNAPEPKTKKQRVVKDDIPPLNFKLYITKERFIKYYGEEHQDEYDKLSYFEI